MHGVVVHVSKETGVILEALVPSQEGVIELKINDHSVPDLVSVEIAVWNHEVEVLHICLVIATARPGWTHILVRPVSMGAPHVLNSLVDLVLVSLLSHVGWHEEPKGHILNLKLVDCCKE